MRRLSWAFCAALIVASNPAIGTDTVPLVEVRLLRVEGAAAGVRRSAERLEEITKKISNTNALSNLPAVKTEMTDLHRMVVSARLAVTVAIQELQTPQSPK